MNGINVMPQKTRWGGLSSSDLKLIALFLMVLDHIHQFFAFTGVIPLWFTQLGRLSAPLFLFCVVEGFCHTSNKKRYFLRIYAIGAGMGFVQYLMARFGLFVRADGLYPLNAIFQTFVVLLVLLQGVQWLQARKWLRGGVTLACTAVLPYVLSACLPAIMETSSIATELLFFTTQTVLPLHNFVTDGGTWFILGGVILYLFRFNKWVQAGTYAVYSLVSEVLLVRYYCPDATPIQYFTDYFQWMQMFAVVLMLLYNRQRGKALKKLFYAFYPAHIYALYALSCVVYTYTR